MGVVSALTRPLHYFWSYFSALLQQHTGHLPTWGVHLSVSYLSAFSYWSWDSQVEKCWNGSHFLLQWTTFCQNSLPWQICLGWPYMVQLIISLNYKRLWSTWKLQLVFFDCGFYSVCLLINDNKMLVQASWWEALAVGKLRSCSDGQGQA